MGEKEMVKVPDILMFGLGYSACMLYVKKVKKGSDLLEE